MSMTISPQPLKAKGKGFENFVTSQPFVVMNISDAFGINGEGEI